ncbi:structure-specific endonuclease subunit SLX4 [Scheffersomyces xylosifermentans]|uniref:structure-specific endonuclease subunit SLX4 n=1 Tax=Scheffersomyces xylosifermentans TaxID=1304137 RepID=UPI00315C7CD8
MNGEKTSRKTRISGPVESVDGELNSINSYSAAVEDGQEAQEIREEGEKEQVEQEEDEQKKQSMTQPEVQESNDLYFASTQMQARHESVLELESQEERTKKTVSQFLGFRNPSEAAPTVTTRPIRRQTPRLTARAGKRKPKNQSMSAMVRERFNNDKFAYFSGSQSKIDDFLKRIRKVEDLDTLTGSHSSNDNSCLFTKEEWVCILKNIKLKFPDLSATKKKSLNIITRRIQKYEQETEEGMWSQASSLPSISLTDEELKWLYDLSDEQMVSNSSVIDEDLTYGSDDQLQFVMTLSQNKQISKENEVEIDQHRDKGDKEEMADVAARKENSVEEQSKEESVPAEVSQDQEIFSLDNNLGDVIEISDSESEPEVLAVSSPPRKQVEGTIDKLSNDVSSHQKVPVFDPVISFQSFPFASTTGNHTTELAKEGEDLSQVIESISTESPHRLTKFNLDDISIPIDSNTNTLSGTPLSDSNDKHESPHDAYRRDKEQSSYNEENHIISPFKTPTKKSKELLSKFSSPVKFNSPVKPLDTPNKSPFHLITRSADSQTVAEEIVISSDEESIYSTARSGFPSAQKIESLYVKSDDDDDDEEFPQIISSIPAKSFDNIKKRRLLRTTRYEVTTNFNLNDFEDNERHVKLRKLEAKRIIIDSDNEVPDSEADDEDQNISIIEITREVGDENNTDYLSNLARDSDGVANTSILQVPSSPNEIILEDGENVSNEDKDLFYTLPGSQVIDSAVRIESIVSNEQNSKAGTQKRLNFSTYTTKELHEKIKEWGLKSVQGRERMIQVLSETSKLVVNSQMSKSPAKTQTAPEESQRLFKKYSYAKMNSLIQQNKYWYDKVLSYEPLRMSELKEWLQSEGYNLEDDFLAKFCDEQGICRTNQV